MTQWQAVPGSTLLIPSGPSGHHLFILVLGPLVVANYGSMAQVAMVSVTSIRDGAPHDSACEIQSGEHPFIEHPSYVAYRYMRIDSESHACEMVAKKIWVPNHSCSAELLSRIVGGVCRSRSISREFKQIFGCL